MKLFSKRDTAKASDPTIATKENPVQWLSDISAKDKPWDGHRSETGKVGRVYRLADDSRFVRYAERMADCSDLLEFGDNVNEETGEIVLKLVHANFCRVRFCPVCQWRRSLRWKAKFLQTVPKIEAAYPNYRWLVLTVTVRNPPMENLRETIRAMSYGWNKMTRYKPFPAVGGVRSLEVTKGKDGNPHPHYHALLLVSPSYFKGKNYLSHEKWVALWRKAMKLDYDPLVNVQTVKPNKRRGGDEETAIRDAAAEVLKYAVKPADLVGDDPAWLWALTDQLHKTRSVEVFGELKPFFKDMEREENADLVHTDEDGDAGRNEGGQFFNWFPRHDRYGRFRKKEDM